MSIRRRKDRTHLVAEARVRSIIHPYYLRLYLWGTPEGYEANVDTESRAKFCSTGYVYDVREGIGRQIEPCLGELHFLAGDWDEDVAAHEVQHAVLYRIAAAGPHWQRILNDQNFPDERQDGDDAHALVSRANEEVCTEAGRWVKAVLRFLWTHDPNPTWRKEGAADAHA